MSDLAKQKCVPCRIGAKPLTQKEAEVFMRNLVNDWRLEEGKLVRTVVGKDFMDVVRMLDEIAKIAEDEGHHPNMQIHDYKKLTLELYTHKIKGLHGNDFILAAKIDELLRNKGYEIKKSN